MHRSGDGDIIVPQRALSVVGTCSWTVDDPDELGVPEDHVARMYDEGAKLIPAVKDATFRAAWSAARPLIGSRGEADSGRELSRTFKTIDHAEEDGVEGFVTITGGKATTLRGDGGALRRRRPPQARHRGPVPDPRHRPAPPLGLLRDERTRMSGDTRRFRVLRFKRGGDDESQHGDLRSTCRSGRARRSSRRSAGSSCTSTARSPCGTRASTPPAARAACA